jgi:superfamily II DNA or RNA helicase
MKNYKEFLENKRITTHASGFEADREKLNPMMFDYEKDITKWALKKGRAAVWSACGTGKTFIELEYSNQVHIYTGGDILMVMPLAVSSQTAQEGLKFGIPTNLCRTQADVKPGINITNYEMLEHF